MPKEEHTLTFSQTFFFYYFTFTAALHRFGMPLLVLLMRFWVAKIFWYTGKMLHSFSLIELSCAFLLMLGFFSRTAALILMVLTIYLQLHNPAITEYFCWLLLLTTIFIHGPGILSLDHYIVKRFKLRHPYHVAHQS